MKEAVNQQNLLEIYSVYEKLAAAKSSAPRAGTSTANGSSGTPAPKPATIPSSTTPESESLKKQGNAAMSSKDYLGAVDFYTRALSISPANPIYSPTAQQPTALCPGTAKQLPTPS